jgi:hypothetical protein
MYLPSVLYLPVLCLSVHTICLSVCLAFCLPSCLPSCLPASLLIREAANLNIRKKITAEVIYIIVSLLEGPGGGGGGRIILFANQFSKKIK